jgi:hypothetical protein
MKLLCCLRILARGAYQDDIAEMSQCFTSSVHTFFRQFLRNFTPQFYETYVRPPTGIRLAKVMAVYSNMGLMGAMVSMDVTHVFWGKYPPELHSSCTGKEKKPTVAFQCVVDPSNYIHSCSKLIHGAECDAQICRNDPYTKKFIEGVYSNMKFQLITGVGIVREAFGGYLICDGGYPKYNCFICPLHKRVDRQSVIFLNGWNQLGKMWNAHLDN